MKETGIVRRIDELGRVVIPKEIRRTMRIREGEEMEVFVAEDNTVMLKKYSPLLALQDIAKDYRSIIERALGEEVIVTDKDVIIAAAKKVDIGKPISKKLESLIYERKPSGHGIMLSVTDEEPDAKDMMVVPIVFQGDPLGSIIVKAYNGQLSLSDEKLVETAGECLTLQLG